jgi:hypothetical protein
MAPAAVFPGVIYALEFIAVAVGAFGGEFTGPEIAGESAARNHHAAAERTVRHGRR